MCGGESWRRQKSNQLCIAHRSDRKYGWHMFISSCGCRVFSTIAHDRSNPYSTNDYRGYSNVGLDWIGRCTECRIGDANYRFRGGGLESRMDSYYLSG